MLEKFHIILLSETHFSERIKCPDGFVYIGRSEIIKSKKPRGGVAVFKRNDCSFDIEVVCNSFRDCVICQIKDTNFIFASIYIPPSNSVYYSDIYWENLDFIYNKFKASHLIVIDDMNARIGTVKYNNRLFSHNKNPDEIVNINGSRLIRWVNEKEHFVIVNGLIFNDKLFDTDFTYYRGNVRSQNDLVFSNNIDVIESMKILGKQIYSDHCRFFNHFAFCIIEYSE